MNTLQEAAATAKLSVDLSTVSDDRLIELCLLYRSVPDALRTFPTSLNAEIERRFTAEHIADEDVMFSVLQNFANQFNSPASYFAYKMQEMAAQVNRDIWFSDNEQWFKAQIDDKENMAWLVSEPSVLEKCLNNRHALAWIGQSNVASTAVLTNQDAVALWKNADNLWQIWPTCEQGMSILMQSSSLLRAIFNDGKALSAVLASDVAVEMLIRSRDAFDAVLESKETIKAFVSSSRALDAIFEYDEALRKVMMNAEFMAQAVSSVTARPMFFSHNREFQENRHILYRMVQANWQRHRVYKTSQNSMVESAGNIVLNPAGIVFAVLGCHSARYSARTTLKHQNGVQAANNNRYLGDNFDEMSGHIDGVSFNGATFQESDRYARVYVEFWTPRS